MIEPLDHWSQLSSRRTRRRFLRPQLPPASVGIRNPAGEPTDSAQHALNTNAR